jgi:predicted nucleic acid-binding protein
MIFNGTDWTVIGTQAGGVVAVLYGGYRFFAKRFPKATQAVEQDLAKKLPHGVVTVAEDAFKFVEHIAESPFFAGKVAEGELKAKHVLDELTQTKAVSEAKTVLLGIGKVYASLTDAEKLKAEITLKLALSGIGIAMTDTQIAAVFAEAQKAIESIQATAMFKASFEQPAQPQA